MTSFALAAVPASHGAVVIALLPAGTATMAVLRGRERPPPAFWLLGAWQTVSWALVLASPLMVFLTALSMSHQLPSGTALQWAAFAYLGVVSMFLGFFAWYHGLAVGPVAQVGQVQLIQPVLSICWAGLLLGEQLP